MKKSLKDEAMRKRKMILKEKRQVTFASLNRDQMVEENHG
jgi:hypothetical protein